MSEPTTMAEKVVQDLTEEELQQIDETLTQLKNGGFSQPVTDVDLKYPHKSSEVVAYAPATRGTEARKLATFYAAGQGGGTLARTLQLAVRYLDLLPVAVRQLRKFESAATQPRANNGGM